MPGFSTNFRKFRPTPRRGIVALELILVFPLLIILVFGVIEFGLIMAAANHVEMAARLGAKTAAESAMLDTVNQPIPNTIPTGFENVKIDVDRYLNTAGYTDSCEVILEHSVAAFGNTTQNNPLNSTCPCTPDGVALANLPANAVRVTVCLELVGNVPNCLGSFGFDLTGKTVRQSVVWYYEQP